MPKLWHSDYYMEPMIQELVAKESVELDFFFRVKDLVIGRRGYGSLKLLGKATLELLLLYGTNDTIISSERECRPL